MTKIFSALLVLLWACWAHLASCRTFDRCHLANLFLHKYKFPRDQIDDLVCLARWESHYNTSAVGSLNWDGSRDFGLFQFSELWWCVAGPPGEWGKGCDANCDDFLDDDIDDDVACLKTVYDEFQGREGEGFDAWVAWKVHCRDRDLSEFLEGCRLNGGAKEDEEEVQKPTQKPPPDYRPGIVAPAMKRPKEQQSHHRRRPPAAPLQMWFPAHGRMPMLPPPPIMLTPVRGR